MDRFRVVIQEKFHIVHESEQQGGELVVEVILFLLNEFRPGQACDSRL
jgi:hypothetical protein